MADRQNLVPSHSIFICYRHDDARYAADILEAKLRESFGDAAVFRDMSRIPGGADVQQSISQALRTCRVGVVVIGSRWLTLRTGDGKRRIDNDDDFVRMEIAALLSFKRRRTIPIYVDGAVPLAPDDPPASISALARLNGLSVRHGKDLSSDLERVVGNVRDALRNWSESPRARFETPPRKQLHQKLSHSRGGRSSLASYIFSKIKKTFVPLIWDDIAVDLGTANTRIYARGRGLVLDEPSLVAVQTGTNHIVSLGEEAKRLLAEGPSNIVAVRPVRRGAIADHEFVEEMLRTFFWRIKEDRAFEARPRVVLSVPSGSTEAEKHVFREVFSLAGACEIYLIEHAIAAAIGIGMDINEVVAKCVVSSGAGVTEAAIIALGGIVWSCSERVAGDDLDSAIVRHLKNTRELMIGERTAEELKTKVGSAQPPEKEVSVSVRGRDLRSGSAKTVVVTSREIWDALFEPVSRMVEAVRVTLERCPPELAEDVMESGIFLAGGGAMLHGLDTHIANETGLRVQVAANATSAVVEGAGVASDELLISK